MEGTPSPEYYSLTQLCETLGFDKSQIQHTIKKHKIRLFIYIDNKKNPLSDLLNSENKFTVEEEKYNAIMPLEIEKLSNLSEQELRDEGYTIIPLSEPRNSLVQKNNIEFVISYENGYKTIRLPPSDSKEVAHDGYIELCDDSFHNPGHSIAGLFRGEEAEVFYVHCEKEGYIRHLSAFCKIFLDDVYIHRDEISRIRNLFNLTYTPANSNEISKQIKTKPATNNKLKTTPKPKTKTLNRLKLERFIEHLVTRSPYDTFPKFKDAMTHDYFYKGGNKPNDDETYNEHDEIKRVFGTVKKDSDNIKLTEIVHFSFLTITGKYIPQDPYSLTSFNRIYTEIRRRLSNKGSNIDQE